MRHLIVAFSFVVASGLFSAASAQPPSSPNTDRPGGDYSNFEIGVPPACRDACMKDGRSWHGRTSNPASRVDGHAAG